MSVIRDLINTNNMKTSEIDVEGDSIEYKNIRQLPSSNDDEKEEIVERIYQTKVDLRHAISFSVAEKAKIRHMLEDMDK